MPGIGYRRVILITSSEKDNSVPWFHNQNSDFFMQWHEKPPGYFTVSENHLKIYKKISRRTNWGTFSKLYDEISVDDGSCSRGDRY